MAYRDGDDRWIARVTSAGPVDDLLQVKRHNEPAESIPASSIVGKVIFNTRTASSDDSHSDGQTMDSNGTSSTSEPKFGEQAENVTV